MNIVILAAGLGKRMYSHLPKVLQPVGGKAMLKHVVEAARRLPDAGKIIVVVGHGSEEVKEAMVSIEDKKFYSHGGIDFKEIGRAHV